MFTLNYIALLSIKYQVFKNEICPLSIFMAHGSNTAVVFTKAKLDV